MFYRQKILLSLIEAFGGTLSRVDLQKYLFLYTKQCQKEPSYDFVPYKYGCFSFQSYADRRNLTNAGVLSSTDEWQLADDVGFLNNLKKGDREKIIQFAAYYAPISGDSLVRDVYIRYPYYATRSEIAGRLLSSDELLHVENARAIDEEECFYTIGYEGSSFEGYLNRLIKNNIKLLCDVRRNPLSRKYGFSKSTLKDTLNKLDIEYIHIPELGIVSEKRQELKSQDDYKRLFNEYERTTLHENEAALIQLQGLLKQHKRIAITCFEAEECMCHRGRVAKALAQMPDWDCPIEHL